MHMDKLNEFTLAYIECMLWSSNDESDESGGQPLDSNYSIEDIADEAMRTIMADCAAFQGSSAYLAAEQASEAAVYRTHTRDGEYYSVAAQAGHDFWLTRNGHGTGFWDDGRWHEPHGTAMDELAKSFREANPYIGDDGQIYIS
jgi:hypothetical protein